MKKILYCLFLNLIVSLPVFAKSTDPNHILHVMVINGTKATLHYEGATNTHAGNVFTINTNFIKSGESAILTGEKTLNNDLTAHIIFSNTDHVSIPLFILDQEQIHFGQPVFNVSTEKHQSLLLEKIRNKNVGPRYLTYVKATVKIIEK